MFPDLYTTGVGVGFKASVAILPSSGDGADFIFMGARLFLLDTCLVSQYSAICDTISCDAPYSAIGVGGEHFLRYPPPLLRSGFGLLL